MAWNLRKLRPGELDHELVWLGVSIACAALGGLWILLRLPVPPCAMYRTTGVPCPTCRATRCVLHLVHLNPVRAFLMNPLVFMGLAGVVLYDIYAVVVLVLRLPRVRDVRLSRGAARLVRVGAVVVVVVNWVYLMLVL